MRPLLLSSAALLSCALSLSAQAETIGEWGVRALAIQSSLDNDAPLYETTWVGSHNSYSNADDDNVLGAVTNQSMSITDQLNHGVRELVFDLHYRSNAVRLCHDNTSLGACIDGITGNRKFTNAMDDVIDWINNGNQDQVILLKMELANTAKDNINKVRKKVDNYLGYYYLPSGVSSHGNLGSNGCTALPVELTKSKVLASGKNIILLNTDSCRDNGGFNDMVFYGGNNIDDYNNTNDVKNAPTLRITRVKDGATKDSNSSVKLQPNSVQGYLEAGLNIFELYGYDADGSKWKKDGELPVAPEQMVWSWDASGFEPNGSGHCAALNGSSNHFRDENCNQQYYVACRRLSDSNGNRAYNDWLLSSSKTHFANAEQQCLNDSGGHYVFATPRNQQELSQLLTIRNNQLGVQTLWLNYTRVNGIWWADIGEADSQMQTSCNSYPSDFCSSLNHYIQLLDNSRL